jgi:hypothetical protein
MNKKQSWAVDQLAKSQFFHQKLHEWELLEVAEQLEQIQGERLSWDRNDLAISEKAWDKIIHRGVKPLVVFAHPEILTTIARAASYYRMLAMVSQKSMNQVGLPTTRYEMGYAPQLETAERIARHLNDIISKLIEADETINGREFDLWRGMAAGSQAQGSWQNAKGRKMEIVLQGVIRRRLQASGLLAEPDGRSRLALLDGRKIVFADEPDIAIYQGGVIVAAVEVKGGIDKAGVLERVGAAMKSLSRAKEQNPAAITVLILPEVSMTPQAAVDLQTNQPTVNHWFTVEELLQNGNKQEALFNLLHL